MRKLVIDKKRFFLKLLKNFLKINDLEKAIVETIGQMKINPNELNRIKTEFFPDGFLSLIMEVNEIINERIRKEKRPSNFKNFKINEKIQFFVIRRLEIFNELLDKFKFFKESVKPFMILNSSKLLFKIADEIWYLSGDRSTDYNYYTKRFILMKIYALTFSFYIFDRSLNLENTKKFLKKQIDLVLGFGKFKKKIKDRINS
tara:strand:+ start:6379 stop:6984 length:606 start_codon:yes stop_codon:yes gene_type:complete